MRGIALQGAGRRAQFVGDVNRDGTPDLLVSTTDKKLLSMLGYGRGGLAPARPLITSLQS